MASLNPAKASKISHHTGSIEVGKDADLLIVKLVNNLPMVTHTIVQGHIVAQARHKETYSDDGELNDNLQVANEL
jgi:alpha-D-ribose 1-methylphosphonate 5-triphosphate diphosphatase